MDLNNIIITTINKFHNDVEKEIEKMHNLDERSIQEENSLSTLVGYLVLINSEVIMMNIFSDKDGFALVIEHLMDLKSIVAERIADLLHEMGTKTLYVDYNKNDILDLRTLLNKTKAQRAFRYYLCWITIFEFDIVNLMFSNKNFIKSLYYEKMLQYLDWIITQGCLMDDDMAHDLMNEKTALMISVTRRSFPNVFQECNEILKDENEKSKTSRLLVEDDEKEILYN